MTTRAIFTAVATAGLLVAAGLTAGCEEKKTRRGKRAATTRVSDGPAASDLGPERPFVPERSIDVVIGEVWAEGEERDEDAVGQEIADPNEDEPRVDDEAPVVEDDPDRSEGP